MIDINKGEILSPVGNKEMLSAAIRSGADAVYLGAKDFSARRNAENFSAEELKEVVSYCHIRGVKVYLTLNIIIKDSELTEAFALARTAYNAGIDGVIIQDLGLAKILHENLPELKLHASTQMSVHSPSALPLLKDLGFCQVVAAREMSRKELKALCVKAKELGMIVEVFVHGALCMSVSGQCLLSAFLGSRSGNRGLCAGPCRLPFEVKGGTGYDLSLKDLSLLQYLQELYEIGVRSFKIEGRMKRPEYVAAATAACREALDQGRVENQLELTLKNVFSRSGFTAGYYEGKLGRNMFGIRTKEDVVSADLAFPAIHELYRKERSAVPIKLKANILSGKPITLTLSDYEGNCVTLSGDIPQSAQNKPLSPESAAKNLCKFGATAYFVKEQEINISDGLFVPAGLLNEIRRKATEELDLKRGRLTHQESTAQYTPKFSKPQAPRSTQQLFARFESAEQIPDDLSGIDAIIFPIEKDPEKLSGLGVPVIADIPRGISEEQNILDWLENYKKIGCNKALCGNLAAVKLALESGFEIIADQGLNIANGESLNQLSAWGINGSVLSCELSLGDISHLNSNLKTGIVAYGNIPLMLFRNCPLKNGSSCADCNKNGKITDRKNTEFPVRCRGGYSELLNSVPIWLADKKHDFDNLDFIILYFTRESKSEAGSVINSYKNGSAPIGKYTRGLYYRGVI